MKEKILAELKKKFPGLSNELLGLVADKMATKITAEDQIQGGITELENSPLSITDYAAFLQKEGDRRVNEGIRANEKTLREKYDFVDKANPPKPSPNPNEPDSDLRKQIEALSGKLTALEQKEQKQLLNEKFIKALADKKIPASFARGRVPEAEDKIEALVADAEAEYNEIKQSFANEGLSTHGAPLGGNGTVPAKVDDDIKSWAEKSAPKEKV